MAADDGLSTTNHSIHAQKKHDDGDHTGANSGPDGWTDTESMSFTAAPLVSLPTSQSAQQARDRATTLAVGQYLKERAKSWSAVASKTGPLLLADLPVEVLGLIIREITHTNDLTSLARTSSTFYQLTVPNIYARFDIVWPDSNLAVSDIKSVDALTYGLSTLCLGSKFAQLRRWQDGQPLNKADPSFTRLLNNQYATFTRKFSLGNGPPDWVAEYMITKESGKMLGTLVAAAVSRMINLESFVWDMPTGILSDVFMALASLRDNSDNDWPKLEKLWVRWHDNTENRVAILPTAMSPASDVQHAVNDVAPPSIVAPEGVMVPKPPPSRPAPMYSDSHVEYPTFSILPPMKSLTVLDIDEVAYLDEMSVLIERSRHTLGELRVGLSRKACAEALDFTKKWEGVDLEQVDRNARWPGENSLGDKRLGGPLGVLVGRLYSLRDNRWYAQKMPREKTGDGDGKKGHAEATKTTGTWRSVNHQLRLHTLELERVPLSSQVCCKVFDWSVLTSLTILDCAHHESLWKALRQRHRMNAPPGAPPGAPMQYHMALRSIRTDATTLALISFINETLAPNSLEVLFLQDTFHTTSAPAVTIEQIFKGAVRRHSRSLTKLSIDCIMGQGGEAVNEDRWMHWVLTTDMIKYITSGRMEKLKELSAAMHYPAWHAFLQRLPNIRQLRSLLIHAILDYPGGRFEPRELAMQLVDIITLRPEVELCYVGLAHKCFEIVETQLADNAIPRHQHNPGATSVLHGDDTDDADMSETDEEDDGDEDEDDEASDLGDQAAGDDESDDSVLADDFLVEEKEEAEAEGSVSPVLRLREILFYDDKVAIFKARHGRL